MRRMILVVAIAALAGCNKPVANQPADDTNLVENSGDANAVATDANATGPALASLNETTWEFVDPKTNKPIRESVDSSGKYITVSGTEHIDHGTVAMKDGKACFTSAMNKEGEVCWTDPMLAEGQSGQTTSDKGEALVVKRTAYVPLTM